MDRAMKDTALYEHLLGLKTPWSVKQVDLSLADQRVVVEVVLKKGQVWADPTDPTKRAHVNGWTERQWRHLDTCQFETLIKARVPQLKYVERGMLRRTEEAISHLGIDEKSSEKGHRYATILTDIDRSRVARLGA